MTEVYSIFLSHSWIIHNDGDWLIQHLNHITDFHCQFLAVPKDHPAHWTFHSQELMEEIQRRMKPCQVVLMRADTYWFLRLWIEKEIQIAKNAFAPPKPLIAVQPPAARKITGIIRESADRIVPLRAEPIIHAIREVIL